MQSSSLESLPAGAPFAGLLLVLSGMASVAAASEGSSATEPDPDWAADIFLGFFGNLMPTRSSHNNQYTCWIQLL